MWTETRRPRDLQGVIGHVEVKQALESYLKSTPPYTTAIVLSGPPGIGKTTMALAAGHSFGFDVTEINASQSMRSYKDVETLRDACRSSVSVSSLLRGERRRICVVLDEIDGSDPHAQRKLAEWLSSGSLTVPVICTCNELPVLFKKPLIQAIRCFPPKTAEFQALFPREDMESLVVECRHDVRQLFQRLQYGVSESLPKAPSVSLKWSIEVAHLVRQKTWTETEPIHRAFETIASEPPSSRSQHSRPST